MRQIRISAAVAIAGLGALALLATPSFAASDQSAVRIEPASPVPGAAVGLVMETVRTPDRRARGGQTPE